MYTVRETATFSAQAQALLTIDEYEQAITEMASNPLKGDIIPGTGGVRKLRVAAGGKGKRGGARVIYFHFDEMHPIHAIAIFAKNEKADLTAKERIELKKLTESLKAAWRKRD
jgi:hypothetical protein